MTLDGVVAFVLNEPAELRVPFLFNSPHSGRVYPHSFLKQTILNELDIRMSEDSYVDLLFADVVRLGGCFMAANFPRAFLDVNREAYELDGEMFEDALPEFVPAPSLRVAAGLGTVPKIVATNVNIYDSKISLTEALNRIDDFYFPYHETLKNKISDIYQKFGFSVLIDCHSMPGNLKYFGGMEQPDFILGDRYGRSCATALSLYAAELLRAKGYSVSLNRPYSGGYITSHYGRPNDGLHTLQVEINRSLYLNEISLQLTGHFEQLKSDLMSFSADLMSIPDEEFLPHRNAAE